MKADRIQIALRVDMETYLKLKKYIKDENLPDSLAGAVKRILRTALYER